MKKLIAVLGSVVLMAALACTTVTDVRADEGDTIEQGIYIGNVDVSGMTEDQALSAVQKYLDELGSREITLNAMNGNSLTISVDDTGLTWTNSDVIEEAIGVGKTGNVITRYKLLKDLEHENLKLPLEFTVDRQAVQSIIEQECEQFNVSAVDATLTRKDGAFVIEPGQTGVVINAEQSTDQLVSFLTGSWDQQNASFDLVVETDEPRGTTEELSQVKDVLGTFTTSYSTSGTNRSGNVANGCRLINDTTLYPGDTFSVYNAVSPFTEENGYYLAGSYSGGLVVESLGGGICQVSTTLYNAVLRAELEVVERHNHSMIVTYVDPSMDAAISGTAKDFKFTNNTEHPIYIEGYTSGDKHITFTIYGVETRPSNRTVSFESETLEKTVPEGEKVVGDSSKPVGYVSVQSAHVGYKAQLWKIVKVDGVEESREVINSSVYNPVPKTAAVGTATADPAVAAAIGAAIATQSIDMVRASLAGGAPATPQAQTAAQAAAEQAAVQAQQQAIADQAAADAAALGQQMQQGQGTPQGEGQ
ncbi:MAG: VanW family protein [Lachnospiraceae bacterium]|nr:VanW family protein [Lachnospiraceae bacterium]